MAVGKNPRGRMLCEFPLSPLPDQHHVVLLCCIFIRQFHRAQSGLELVAVVMDDLELLILLTLPPKC